MTLGDPHRWPRGDEWDFWVTSTSEGWEAWTAAVTEVVALLAGGLLLRQPSPPVTRRR